jgi:hypothetical protein
LVTEWVGDQEENVFLPKRIEALDGIHVATVAAESFHALALVLCGRNRRVYSWGARDRHGHPKLGSLVVETTPTRRYGH